MCCSSGVSCGLTLDVSVHLFHKPSYVNGEIWDKLNLQVDDVSQHPQLLRSRVNWWSSAQAQIWMKPRLPNGRESTAQLENKSCVCSVVVSRADSDIFRRCFYSSDEVAWSLSRHKLAFCTCFFTRCCYFSNFASSFFFCRVVCVGCEVCFVVFFVRVFWICFEQIDVVSTNSVT